MKKRLVASGVRTLLVLSIPTLSLLTFYGCENNPGAGALAKEGIFTFITYNVAGLPQGISASDPETNIPLIGPLLNAYDIAVVQEDFFYHEQLASGSLHPHKSTPKAPANTFTSGDGLNRFSRFALKRFNRQEWRRCSNVSGDDCRARKGFSVAETEISSGVMIDIYNLHMDSGSTASDVEARREQLAQLIETIRTRSGSKAVIVAGDTNLNTVQRAADDTLFQMLLRETDLIDACRETGCSRELVDRVLFRSAADIQLEVTSWEADAAFVDSAGEKLSDHEAITATFRWNTK